MLGGGTWLVQNKILPGAYINVFAASRANSAFSERGIATMPYVLDWGAMGEVIEVTAGDFQRNSVKLFGYDFTAPQMRPFRELFRNTRIALLYRLGTGGVKAENDYATANYAGERGNALKLIIATNIDDPARFDVTLLLDGNIVFYQTVATISELAVNDFVVWKNEPLALTPTAGTPFINGASPVITNTNHQSYIDIIEGFTFNSICCPSGEAVIKQLYSEFTRRMRDDQGIKFQCVTYDNAADYEGVVNVMNTVKDDGADAYSLVYWVTGVVAGTAVNKSALNKIYDGEFEIDVNYTQTQLERAIQSGKFGFHRVYDNIRVLADINSLVTLTSEKSDLFQENQTIRVIDQIANDIALIFNTQYLGIVPNDNAGRISLWADIVQHHQQLQTIRAIENFSGEDVTVEQGIDKRAVLVNDHVTVVNSMRVLYMQVWIA